MHVLLGFPQFYVSNFLCIKLFRGSMLPTKFYFTHKHVQRNYCVCDYLLALVCENEQWSTVCKTE